MPATPARAASPVVCAALSLVLPGLGHVALGQVGTGLVYLGSIGLMFVGGLAMAGQFFEIIGAPVLTMAAGLAELGMGVPRLVAGALGFGAGSPAAPGYEYGNGFLISAGLLNLLVVLNAWDIANGAD